VFCEIIDKHAWKCFCIHLHFSQDDDEVLFFFQGTSVRRAVAVSVLIVLLFSSRAVYNFVTVSMSQRLPGFGYDWINVSDQVSAFPRLSLFQ
jgi:hypothetical protein